MADTGIEQLGQVLEAWVDSASATDDVSDIVRDGQDALIEAGMVQYNPNGWDFKLHEKHPNAPRAQFKLMIREAQGVDTSPAYYDRFVLPSVFSASEKDLLRDVDYVLGYPNAGTPIASAFIRLADAHLGIQLDQLLQDKITHPDGKRELGTITSEFAKGEVALTIDDTSTGGDTKIEGSGKILESGLIYKGLVLLVERDPLGSALVRESTGAFVQPSIHWLSVVQQAVEKLDLPGGAVSREMDYTKRLFEWNVANNNIGSLPAVESVDLQRKGL